jgi:hypothetical protein
LLPRTPSSRGRRRLGATTGSLNRPRWASMLALKVPSGARRAPRAKTAYHSRTRCERVGEIESQGCSEGRCRIRDGRAASLAGKCPPQDAWRTSNLRP